MCTFIQKSKKKGVKEISFRESGKTTEKWTTRDILYVVILSVVGAIYSTFSPFGSIINTALPFPGSGWLVAGIHTMFFLIAFGLTLKYFSATAAGAIKGLFELIFGNVRIGVLIIVQGAMIGLLIDVFYIIFKLLNKEKAQNDEGLLSWIFPWMIGSGIGSAIALPIFYSALGLLENPALASMLWFMMLIAFLSGVVFGAIARVIREVIIRAGVPSAVIRE